MTVDMMTLRSLLENNSDADLLREMIGFTAQRLMALKVQGLTGAGHSERSPERINQRNGYRERVWETRAGTVELRIPMLRKRAYFPGCQWSALPKDPPPKRADAHRQVVLPKRWIVERTFTWISRNRRLARDFERYARTVVAFVRLALIRTMLGRLAPPNPC